MEHTRTRTNERPSSLEIQFIGGPYDGHRATCVSDPEYLAPDLAWFVGDHLFRMLDGKKIKPQWPDDERRLVSTASMNGVYRYLFTGATSAKAFMRCLRGASVNTPPRRTTTESANPIH